MRKWNFVAMGQVGLTGWTRVAARADVEAHFVRQNSQGDNAVVGVFFRRGDNPNPLLDKILFSAPVTAGDEVTVGEANPAELFPRTGHGAKKKLNVGSFYTYSGSLTTLGCTEGVRWFVLAGGVVCWWPAVLIVNRAPARALPAGRVHAWVVSQAREMTRLRGPPTRAARRRARRKRTPGITVAASGESGHEKAPFLLLANCLARPSPQMVTDASSQPGT